MKIFKTLIFLFAGVFLCSSCKDSLTSEVTITVINESLSNQDNYFVKVDIVFLESDNQSFVDFEIRDISNGGTTSFKSTKLNIGNYYVRYQYYLGSSTSGPLYHKPFQIQAGEDNEVTIIK